MNAPIFHSWPLKIVKMTSKDNYRDEDGRLSRRGWTTPRRGWTKLGGGWTTIQNAFGQSMKLGWAGGIPL